MGRMKETIPEQTPPSGAPELQGEAQQMVVQEAPRTPMQTIPGVDPLLLMIERASRDQNIDVVKLRELMALYQDQKQIIAENEFAAAMNRVQTKLEPVRKDADNPHTHSKFASYAALDNAVRPFYTEEGFSVSFTEEETDKPDTVKMIAWVRHKDGHKERYMRIIPAEGKGAKGGEVMSKTHAAGSAGTYAKRYLLSMIFNIATMDDDDGNKAGSTVKAKPAPQERQQTVEKIAPQEIPRPEGGTAAAWVSKIIQQIALCTSADEVQQWLDANKKNLDDLKAKAEKLYGTFQSALDKKVASL